MEKKKKIACAKINDILVSNLIWIIEILFTGKTAENKYRSKKIKNLISDFEKF